MKKILLLTLLFVNFSYFCYSQEDKLQRAEEIQKAYLTKELGLSPEEAQKFWPVFNNYKGEIRKARTESRGNVVETNEKIVNIQKKYQGEFRKVFTDQRRVDKVFESDQNFRDMLRKELENRNKGMDDKQSKQNGKKN